MADYNVNMKQWNGTSFDNVLPLAYNAKQLEGQSLAEVKQWVQDNGLLLYTGSYIGTGTYGNAHPMTLQFPFEPVILFMPVDPQNNNPSIPFPTNSLTNSYKSFQLYSQSSVNIKMSSDGKSILFYGTDQYKQFNISGNVYYFAAIGGYDMGGQIPAGTTFTITSNETWRVPATGRYMLELYGMGGNGFGTKGYGASGGSSCQHYDSVALTKGSIQQVVIGDSSHSATKFGSYSVNNGGNASSNAGGLGSGNYGTNGTTGSDLSINLSNGALSGRYGYGGNWSFGSAAPGAVYLKYLGA